MKTNTIVAALLASGLAAAPAEAQGRSWSISYADLDLGTEADRRILDLRIAHAVNAACGEASPADLRGQNAARACRVTLREAAQREVALASVRRSGVRALARR